MSSAAEQRRDDDFRQAAAEDRASALERHDLEMAFESYGGTLSFEEFEKELYRRDDLERLGYEAQEIPEAHAAALGPDRTAKLERQIEDKLLERSALPLSHEERTAQAQPRARGYGASARALKKELGTYVVGLEARRDEITYELEQLENEDLAAPETLLRDQQAVREQLHSLEQVRSDHPDRWMENHSEQFVDSLAAQAEIQRVREMAEEGVEPALGPAAPAVEVGTDAGIDFF